MATFVNEPLIYTFIVYMLTEVVSSLLYGNYSSSDSRGAAARTQFRFAAFFSVAITWLISSGVYVQTNYNVITTNSSATDNEKYQSGRNLWIYIQFVVMFVLILAMQLFKMFTRDSKKDEDKEEDAVQGYAGSTALWAHEHFQMFMDENSGVSSMSGAVMWLGLGVDTTMMLMVLIHSTQFASAGASPVIRQWDYAAAVCGSVAVFWVMAVTIIFNRKAHAIFYNPNTKLHHDHGHDELTEEEREDAGCLHRVKNVFWNPMPPMRLVFFRLAPSMIMAHTFMTLCTAFNFFNDYASLTLYVFMKVIFPHIASSRTMTHATWFNYYVVGSFAFCMAWFFFPAFYTMQQSVEKDNRFIPVVGSTNRHLLMPMEYANADLIYRTSWVGTEYKHLALVQSYCGYITPVFLAVLILFDTVFSTGKTVIYTSYARMAHAAPRSLQSLFVAKMSLPEAKIGV